MRSTKSLRTNVLTQFQDCEVLDGETVVGQIDFEVGPYGSLDGSTRSTFKATFLPTNDSMHFDTLRDAVNWVYARYANFELP